jgi:hypothetical protein
VGQGPETEFAGRCHCGAVEITFTTRRAVGELPLRACQCSFCRKHGARTTSDPDGWLEIRAAEREALARYKFGLGTADYLVCRRCGVYVAAVMEEAGKSVAIVNVNALIEAAAFDRAATPMVYDREDEAGRRARRRKLWTPAAIVAS